MRKQTLALAIGTVGLAAVGAGLHSELAALGAVILFIVFCCDVLF